MNRQLKPYPRYGPSGIPWLGEVPEHWPSHRVKEVASVQPSNVDKKSVEGEQAVYLCNYTDVYGNEKITKGIEFMEATAPASQIERFLIRKGDVLVTKDSETPDDIAVPAVVADELSNVLCGYHLALLKPKTNVIDGRFLARAFAATGIRDQFYSAANGVTRFALGYDELSCARLPVPPIDEQHSIAAFLDHTTGQLDDLIARKQRLIELLKEKRQALITQAVTKGLNPKAKMKDSGVPWLGQIPEHWKVLPLRRLGYLQGGTGFPHEFQGRLNEAVPFYKVDDLNLDEGSRYLKTTTNTISMEDVKTLGAKILARGSVVFPKVGAALMGNNRKLLTRESIVDNNMMGFISEGVSEEFIYFSFLIQDLGRLRNPGPVPSVNEGQIKTLLVALPPSDEQNDIVAYLDRSINKLDVVLQSTELSVRGLNEYRQSLISAAVTGKIDLRNWKTA